MIPYHASNKCPVCTGVMRPVFALPKLPLTERLEPFTQTFKDGPYLDQAFLFCEACSHGKLLNIIEPEFLYSKDYVHRTSTSLSAESAAIRFASFVQRQAKAPTVIDIGGGDGFLLDQFKDSVTVCVDPNALGEIVVKELFEDADLSEFKSDLKIFICSHTFEHIDDVNAFLKKVSELWKAGDSLAISVPGLDCLISDGRIDHIHHQHIHYFSERSLGLLLAKHGFGIRSMTYDYQHWGALQVVCDRKVRPVSSSLITHQKINRLFADYTAFLRDLEVPKFSVGFGAGLMVPILRYHWPQLENLAWICDSDASKDKLRFSTFDKKIQKECEFEDRQVVITGVASKLSCRSLIWEAFKGGARNVIVPLKTL